MKKAIVGAIIVFAIPAFAFAAPKADCTLSASATSIVRGQPVTVKWVASNSNVRFSPQFGFGLPTSGSVVVKPMVSTTYQLTVMSLGSGSNKTCKVKVNVTK